MVSDLVCVQPHTRYHVPAAPPRAVSTGEPPINLLAMLQITVWKTGARVFPELSVTGVHLPPPLRDASRTNLDEGVDFDSPAFGQRFDLHLANGAHVQMVHSRAAPKPGHRNGGEWRIVEWKHLPAPNPTILPWDDALILLILV